MGCASTTHSGSKSWWQASNHRHAPGGECYLLRPARRLPMAPAAERLSASSDGLRLLAKRAVVGGRGNGYTTDCAGMCGKPMVAIGSRALELSTVRQ